MSALDDFKKRKRDLAAAKRAEAALDRRIETVYRKVCPGVAVNILDIGKIFDVGRKALRDNPGFTDDQLGVVISGFVETIRQD